MLKCAAPYWSTHNAQCDVLSTGTVRGDFANALVDVGYAVHHLPSSKTASYLKRFAAFVRKGAYDVVHLHVESMSFWLCLAAMHGGARVVRTVHNSFPFEGMLRLRRTLQRRLLATMGVVFVAIGESVRANELRRCGLRTSVVWNWADLQQMQPPTQDQRRAARAKWGLGDDDLVVVSVGNCSGIKNHAAVLQGLAHCLDVSSIRYLHIGVEDTCRSERTIARDLGVESRVIFAGWLPSPLDGLYAADIYVMPSLFEGFSIAALEAMSVGMPAVLADVPGLVDLRHFFPGLYYVPPNGDEIGQALRKVAQLKPYEREKIGRSYHEIALKNFTAERGVAQYCALYGRSARRRLLRPTQ